MNNGSLFPTNYFDVIVGDGSSREIIRCAARDAHTLAVLERGAYGTTADSWDASTQVIHTFHSPHADRAVNFAYSAPILAYRGTANITASVSESWKDLDPDGTDHARPLDVIIPNVSAGDVVFFRPVFNIGSATGGFLGNVAVIKNGAVQRRFHDDTFGYIPWSIQSGQTRDVNQQSPAYLIKPTDIENNSVRLRFQYIQVSNPRTVNAVSALPLTFEGYGPFKPRIGDMLVFDGQSFQYAPGDGRGLSALILDRVGARPSTLAAVSGTTYTTRQSTIDQRVYPHLVNASSPIVFDVGGQSDIIAGTAAATILSNMHTYHDALKANGAVKTVACTVPPMSSAWTTNESIRTALNPLILASDHWDAVVDLAAISQSSDPSNTTYYSDGLHPTATLAAIWADEIVSVLNDIGVY